MRRLMRTIAAFYGPKFPLVIAYMLQNTEYQPWPYLVWFWRTQDFSSVMRRRDLNRTKVARLVVLALTLGVLAQIMIGAAYIYGGFTDIFRGGVAFGLALLVSYPLVWAHLVIVPLLFGRWLIILPRERRLIAESKRIFANHPGVKIAVAGSYGKTSMKELLLTVLSEGLDVVATPANKNVAISHAYFARRLSGHEDVVIIEFGEGAPGDVERFAHTTQPSAAIITGLAPAHLDRYKTLEAAGRDIFSVAEVAETTYVNLESTAAEPFLKPDFLGYDRHGALGWKVEALKADLTGTRFTLKKGAQTLKLKSKLIGRHQIGVLSLVAALASEFGLTKTQIEAGVAKTAPFEHRMQPYPLSGAWVIDDTYNGNIEGVRAGTQLLADLKASRKWYVTPGLVDQGAETEAVHVEMGGLIAAAKPDIVVLMQNSVTDFISRGLMQAGFTGEVRLESDPLTFYSNLGLQLAAGDVMLMQNDWTDNYA